MTTPAVKSQGEFIVLKPKFKEHLFNGYDQVDGSHFYDTAGKEYRFVPESKLTEALELVDELTLALDKLSEIAQPRYPFKVNGLDWRFPIDGKDWNRAIEALTHAKQKRKTL